MLIGTFAGNPFLSSFALGDFGAAAKKKKAAKAKKVAKVVKAAKAVKAAHVAKAVAASTPQTVAISPEVAKRLQAALVQLGKVTGSATLKAIKVDGAPGAKTATAVNLAFTRHIGPGQAAAQYRTGRLPLDYIKANATALASLIEAEVRRRGAAVVPASTVKKSQPLTKTSAAAAMKKAVAAKTKAAKAAAKKTAAKAKSDHKKLFARNAATRAAVFKTRAAAKKKRAAALKASNPAAAKQLEQEAASDEAVADAGARDAEKYLTEVRAADGEAAAAAEEEAQASGAVQAAAVEAKEAAAVATTEAVQATQAADTPQAVVTTLPTEQSTEMIPGGGGESTFAKYKVPIIGAGVGILGLLAILMLNKKKPAPTMAGARRRRGRR